MANLNLIADPGYLDALKNSRTSKLVELVNQKNAARQRLSDQMTHTGPAQEVPAISALGDYFNKVASGGYLKEHGQNFHDILSGNYEKALDYVGPAPMGGVPAMIGMTAFHGSPHKFNKFSLDNIGTGEGAQAYGHGLYFAESPDTANFYKNTLSKGLKREQLARHLDMPPSYETELFINQLENNNGDISKTLDELKGYADSFKSDGDHQTYNNLMAFKKRVEDKFPTKGKIELKDEFGSLYEVDIPDEHVANFLDWDAPLSEQPESVQKAMVKIAREYPNSFGGIEHTIKNKLNSGGYERFKGRDFYQLLADQFPSDGFEQFSTSTGFALSNSGMKNASEHLNSLGIKGIKYYDGMSRGAGEGTRNLVVFDDSIVKTLKRNGEDILPQNLQRQSGLPDDMINQTDTIPEMLKPQSGI